MYNIIKNKKRKNGPDVSRARFVTSTRFFCFWTAVADRDFTRCQRGPKKGIIHVRAVRLLFIIISRNNTNIIIRLGRVTSGQVRYTVDQKSDRCDNNILVLILILLLLLSREIVFIN